MSTDIQRSAPKRSGVVGNGKAKPRYSEVADQIRLAILTGRYAVGDLLPSEAELRQEFDISRHTVREATRQLQADGLVSPEHGRGIRVESNRAMPRSQVVFSSLDGIERYGRVTRLTVVDHTTILADQKMASLMQCKVGQELIQVRSMREPRTESVKLATAWNEIYFRPEFAGILEELESWPGAIYSLIEKRFDERVTSIRQEANATILESEVASRLSVHPGIAGLQVRRTYINVLGTPLLLGLNTYAGDTFTLTMEIKS